MSALERATLLLRAGRADEALAGFDGALALGADRTVARLGRASALAALGREEEARAEVARLVDDGFETGAGVIVVARWAMAAGDAHLAMALLGAGLRASPELADTVAADRAFAPVADHPLFHQLTGRL